MFLGAQDISYALYYSSGRKDASGFIKIPPFFIAYSLFCADKNVLSDILKDFFLVYPFFNPLP